VSAINWQGFDTKLSSSELTSFRDKPYQLPGGTRRPAKDKAVLLRYF